MNITTGDLSAITKEYVFNTNPIYPDFGYTTFTGTSVTKNTETGLYYMHVKVTDAYGNETVETSAVVNMNNLDYNDALAYYSFDEFAEPTENYYTDPTMDIAKLNITAGAGIYAQSYHDNIANPYGVKVTTIEYLDTGGSPDLHNYGVYKNIYFTNENTITYTSWVKATTGTIIEIRANRIIDDVATWGNAPTEYIATGDWQEISSELNYNTSTGTTTGFNLRVGFKEDDSSLGEKMYIAANQLEIKDHATPYTETTRTGSVSDNSTNNNNVILNISTTPEWVDASESKVGTGSYNFDGTEYASTNISDDGDQLTVSMWVNPTYYGNSTSKTAINSGESVNILSFMRDTGLYTAGPMWFEFRQNGILNVYMRDTLSTTIAPAAVLPIDVWTNITVTYDGAGTGTLYLNGEYYTHGYNGGLTTLEDFGRIFFGTGLATDFGENYKGSLDEVSVWNKVLTADEIKVMYEKDK